VAEVALLLAGVAFNMALCAALVIWDRKRLPPMQRERAWNTASFASAVFAFAPWCILAHFWITRRSIRGILLGLAWLAILLAALIAFNALLAWMLGIEA
jgi:hypothetical protein